MLACARVCGQTKLAPEIRHFISMNGDLGYSALLHTIDNHPASSGLNANLGVGYRLYCNKILISFGAEAAYQLNTNKIEDLDFALKMKDTEGDLFDMHVLVYESRDRSHMVNINVPFYMGAEWKRFYFLVGPKIAINLYGSASSQAEYTTYGEYGRYYADFHNMENHQFVSGNKMESGLLPMKWNLNVLAHMEVGSRIGKFYQYRVYRENPEMMRMYLAAYMDFGTLNLVSTKGNSPLFDYRETEDKGLQFYIQPLMRSDLVNGALVRNINVGIKYTIAFEIQQAGKSFVYDDDKPKQTTRKRGGNQSMR